MLLKFGVSIEHLHDTIRSKLGVIDRIFIEATGSEAVVTSTFEGTHSVGSLHYAHKAIDFRLPPPKNRAAVVSALKAQLGSGYDVVLESTHIHVEYDPK